VKTIHKNNVKEENFETDYSIKNIGGRELHEDGMKQ
jgi:hypothetical protein